MADSRFSISSSFSSVDRCTLSAILFLLQSVCGNRFVCRHFTYWAHHPPLWNNCSATDTAIIHGAHLRLYGNLHIQPHQLAPFVRFWLRKLFYYATHLIVTFSVLELFVYLNTTEYRCPKVLDATALERSGLPLDRNLITPPPE